MLRQWNCVEQQEATDNVYKNSTYPHKKNNTQRESGQNKLGQKNTHSLRSGFPPDLLHQNSTTQDCRLIDCMLRTLHNQTKRQRRFFIGWQPLFLTQEGVCTNRSAQVELQFKLFVSPGKTQKTLCSPEQWRLISRLREHDLPEGDREIVVRAGWWVWRMARDKRLVTDEKRLANLEKGKLLGRKTKLRGRYNCSRYAYPCEQYYN
jgi:hypothetical protein